jgi:cysteinyl-tRNA synthetase
MDDDLGVPAALAVVHSTVRDGNAALDGGDDEPARAALSAVLAMTSILGINPITWAQRGSSELTATVDALVRTLLLQREAARARKDFVASDAIREQLAQAGVVVEDTPAGPRWSLKNR